MRWVVDYSSNVSPRELAPYQLIILEKAKFPLIEGFIQRGKTTLGYLSLGEINRSRPYFSEIEEMGLLLQKNGQWKGAYLIDIRDKRWHCYLIERLIPQVLYDRFDGLFLDTLDSALKLEEKEPETYKGMREAAIKLIKMIRFHYPEIPLMVNRSYAILSTIADQVDMALGESLLTTYNFEKKVYERVPEKVHKEQVAVLKEARQRNPKLRLFSLDYWDPADTVEIKRIYAEEREKGFIPYVGTIELNRIIREPS